MLNKESTDDNNDNIIVPYTHTEIHSHTHTHQLKETTTS